MTVRVSVTNIRVALLEDDLNTKLEALERDGCKVLSVADLGGNGFPNRQFLITYDDEDLHVYGVSPQFPAPAQFASLDWPRN